MPASKADQVETAKRIEQTVLLFLDGYRVPTIVNTLIEQYKISESQAYRYIREATVQVHAKIENNLEDKIAKHYQMLERVYQKAMKKDDLRTARQTLKDMADLFGLDAPKRTDLTSGGEALKPAVFLDVLGIHNDHVIKPTKRGNGGESGSSSNGETSQSSSGDTNS